MNFRATLCCLFVLAAAPWTAAEPIRLLTLDATRNFGSRSEDFVTGTLYSEFRDALTDDANFGTGGTVGRDVELLTAVSALNPTNLAGADVVLWTQRNGPSTVERAALFSFLESGGGLMVVSDAVGFNGNFEGFLGLPSNTLNFQSGFSATNVTSNSNAISDGPFGDIRGDLVTPGAAYFLDGFGEPGLESVTAIFNGSPVELAAFGNHVDGGTTFPGRIALFGDDDIFLTQSGSASFSGRPSHSTLALNSFHFVASAVPEPGTMGVCALMATIGMAHRRRRRRGGTGKAAGRRKA